MEEISVFFNLLWGTVIYRPYVYAFLACYLVFATYHLGEKRMLTFSVSTYLIAFACEYSATRNGFPFGYYTYYDATRTRELWISNVPFWDSLSFVFLSYFSYVVAAAVFTRPEERRHGEWAGLYSRWTPVLGGVIMTLLDVVIDPLTLQGEKWFLGKIYDYPHNGFYFGVTAANFAGWFFVGYSTQWVFQKYLKYVPWCRGDWPKALHPLFVWGAYAVYAGVFVFNLAITVYIQDYVLLAASLAVSGVALTALYLGLCRKLPYLGTDRMPKEAYES